LVFIHENRMKPFEIGLRKGEGKKKYNGSSKSKIYCKCICNYYNASCFTTIIC
jgi:hypothetical protein